MATPSYTQTIFINIPAKDLATAVSFYTALGFVRNATFSNDTAAMMSIPMDLPDPASGSGEADTKAAHKSPLKVMLLTHDRFQGFLPADRTIASASTTAEAMFCLSMRSRDMVDDLVGRAGRVGGRADLRPPLDHGCMYGRSFADPDGHIWETMWMEPTMYEGKE